MTTASARFGSVVAGAVFVVVAVVPILGAPAASADETLNRCQAKITNNTGGKVKVTDAHKGASDKWALPGDPTGKTIDRGDTFEDAQSADEAPNRCGLELKVASVNGDDRWTVIVKFETDGASSAMCRGSSCTVFDQDMTTHKASARFNLK